MNVRLLPVLLFLSLFAMETPLHAALPSAAKRALDSCVSQYNAGKWEAALAACKTSWSASEKSPRFARQSIRLFTAKALYRSGRKALAWKAFEDLLLYDPHVLLGKREPADMRMFFDNVRKRVVKRTGVSLRQLPSFSRKGSAPSWLIPGVVLGLGGAFAVAGALLMVNSGQSLQHFDTLKQEANALGIKGGNLDKTMTPLQSGSSLEGTLGIVSLGLGGACIAGGVVMLMLSSGKNRTASALPPLSNTRRASLRPFLMVR